ncbi:hypothetical protein M413DRAFT_48283, partial [Hebeloma cylindrosporum]
IVPSPEVEANSAAHPFWYGAVIGIFHADVQHAGSRSRDFGWKSMDFLWIRWLGVVPGHSFGRKQAKLPKLGFVPDTDEYAFGFLDPGLVLQGCHLIPAFGDGRTSELLRAEGPTEARRDGETDDWANYYAGIFVDRDMFMRYLGGGIGHKGSVPTSP